MESKERKWLQILKSIEPTICAVGIFITVMAVVINICADFIFHKRFTIAEEIASVGYIWVTFAGMGYLYRVDSFMEVSFVLKSMKTKHRYIAELFRLLYMLFFSAMLIFATFHLLKGSFVKKLVTSRIPYFYLDISVLLGFGSVAIQVIFDLFLWVKNFRRIMKGKDKPWPDGGLHELMMQKDDV